MLFEVQTFLKEQCFLRGRLFEEGGFLNSSFLKRYTHKWPFVIVAIMTDHFETPCKKCVIFFTLNIFVIILLVFEKLGYYSFQMVNSLDEICFLFSLLFCDLNLYKYQIVKYLYVRSEVQAVGVTLTNCI